MAATFRQSLTAHTLTKDDDMNTPHNQTIDDLRTALKDANEFCRIAYDVALRDGKGTNWQSLRYALQVSLDRQHRAMYPPNTKP